MTRGTPRRAPTLDDVRARILRRAKNRITRAMERREVPRTVRFFGDLHDYLDANMLLLDANGDADRAIGPFIATGGVGWSNGFYGGLIADLDRWLARRR